MSLDDGQSTSPMRLLGIGPEEVMLGIGVLFGRGRGFVFGRLSDGGRAVGWHGGQLSGGYAMGWLYSVFCRYKGIVVLC